MISQLSPNKLFFIAGCRKYHANDKLKVVFHQFSSEEAAKIFAKHDANRFFAPKNLPSIKPIKVLLPFFGFNAHVSRCDYSGSYGTDHTYITTDSKGRLVARTHTLWHDTKGTLGPLDYSDVNAGLRAYSGYTWDNDLIEEAMNGFDVTGQLQPLDPNLLSEDTIVDPFLMSESKVRELFYKCIYDYETKRASDDITKRKGSWKVSIEKLNCQYGGNESRYFLPAYILQYPGNPPRILPALNINNATVFGANPLSIPKTMTMSFIFSTLAALAVPQVAIPLRVACLVGGPAMSGLWANYRLGIKHSYQERKMKNKRLENQALIEKERPKEPQKQIEAAKIEPPKVMVTKSVLKYAKVLGISEDEILSEEKIHTAYKSINTNLKGTNREKIALMQDSIEAERELMKYLKKASSNVEA